MQNKVPEVTLGFWVIKILATTLGETGGDTATMTMGLGYLTGTAIFLSALTVLGRHSDCGQEILSRPFIGLSSLPPRQPARPWLTSRRAH